jgi:hypothetical protein
MKVVAREQNGQEMFNWGDYVLLPLTDGGQSGAPIGEGVNLDDEKRLLGLLGFVWQSERLFDEEQMEALSLLAERVAMALRDWRIQQQVVKSLQDLSPQVALIQQIRAKASYDRSMVLINGEGLDTSDFPTWVKEALTHYWGGPKLTKSPLMELKVVKDAVETHEGNYANALRAILRQAIEQVKPEGERRFTAEWILYNILEMKFLEGRKVREVALKLAMSEADLYRKQRVAIEAVAKAILEMEQEARGEETH